MILLITNCGSQEATYTAEIIDGVKHIHNHTQMNYDKPKIKLEFVRKIGDLESEDENYNLYKPRDLTVDGLGNIYVMDTFNYRIQKYNSEGEFLLSIGRKGQGPGEFQWMAGIDILSHGNLLIADFTTYRLDEFTQNGQYIKSHKIEPRPGVFKLNSKDEIVMPGGGLGGDQEMLAMRTQYGRDEEILLNSYGLDGQTHYKIGRITNYGNKYTNTFANRFAFCIDQEDNYFISYRSLNCIEKYSPEGKILLRIDRGLNYDVIKPYAPEITGSGNIKGLKLTWVSEGIGVDEKDRIWVITYRYQRDHPTIKELRKESLTKTKLYYLEIFQNTGEYIDKIELNHFADDIEVFGHRLFILDVFNAMTYYEYRIVDPE
jgi:hypothetical protein